MNNRIMFEKSDCQAEKIDVVFTKYNPEAHLVLNNENIENVLGQLRNGETLQAIRFINQLRNQAYKLDHALETFEANIGLGMSIKID